jgi:hypothetical protein
MSWVVISHCELPGKRLRLFAHFTTIPVHRWMWIRSGSAIGAGRVGNMATSLASFRRLNGSILPKLWIFWPDAQEFLGEIVKIHFSLAFGTAC